VKLAIPQTTQYTVLATPFPYIESI